MVLYEGAYLNTLIVYLRGLFKDKRHLCFLGFFIPQFWTILLLQGNTTFSYTANVVFSFGLVICFFGAAIVYVLRPQTTLAKKFAWIAAVLMCVAPALSLTPLMQNETIASACLLLSGVGRAWCFLQWSLLYMKLPIGQAASYLILSFSLTAAIRFAYVWIPVELSMLVPCLVLLCSLVYPLILHMAQDAADDYRQESKRKNPVGLSLRHVVPAAIELMVFGIILGIFRDMSLTAQSQELAGTLSQSLKIIVPLLLLPWAAGKAQTRGTSILSQFVILTIIIALLALALLGEAGELVSLTLVTTARDLIQLLLMLMLLEMAHYAKTHPIVVFGVGRGLYSLSLLLGVILDHEIGVIDSAVTFNINIVFFVVVCIVLFLSIRSFKAACQIAASEEDPKSSNEAMESGTAFIDARVDKLGDEYGLTSREMEIAKLLCRGRTIGYAAGTLFISENTVKWHCKQLYVKLDVHNRQELLTKIGLGN